MQHRTNHHTRNSKYTMATAPNACDENNGTSKTQTTKNKIPIPSHNERIPTGNTNEEQTHLPKLSVNSSLFGGFWVEFFKSVFSELLLVHV